MFTGIIESTGTVKEVISRGSNRTFWLSCPLAKDFRVDQSVSHSGVCLTVEEIRDAAYRVTAIEETLLKTTIGSWETGTAVNIERSLLLGSRLDGHFVQGHVDTTGTCISQIEKKGSWEFDFEFPSAFSPLMIEKGSICVNGISLTAFNVTRNSFRVAIIPYTFEHTNISQVREGQQVNLEFDMIGKYIDRRLSLQ
jgi:riboflavin synthase